MKHNSKVSIPRVEARVEDAVRNQLSASEKGAIRILILKLTADSYCTHKSGQGDSESMPQDKRMNVQIAFQSPESGEGYSKANSRVSLLAVGSGFVTPAEYLPLISGL